MATFLMMCSEDNKVQPAATLTLEPSTDSGKPGSVVTVNIAFNAPNGAKELFVYAGGVEVDLVTLSGVTSPTTYDYTIPTDAVIGSTLALAFQLVDNAGYPSTIANFLITVGETLSGTLTTRTLDATEQYFLKGQVFIPSGVTVTIPAGTIIKGDKATKATLVVQPGGKLIANGEANNPVIFTSSQAVGARDRGDWGGLVILGNAFVNQTAKPSIEGISPPVTFGSTIAEGATPATNATDDSGTLKYVRVEYAGIELTPNNETNSITFGGVGSGTTVEYVQVSYGGDDGFEWFGGTVNGKYLVSMSTWDDDFDTDFGWGGNVQFGLVVRNTFFADQSGSNAFESDNQANGTAITNCDGTNNTGCTRGVFSNITVLGPRDQQSRSISGNYQNVAHIRRRTAISIFNSFFAGFRVGIRVDDQGTLDNLNNGTSKHAYNVLSVPGATLIGTSTSASDAAFATGLTIPPNAAGNATAISDYWNVNSTVFNNVASNATFNDIGVSSSLFWSDKTASTYPSDPNFALIAGTAGANNLNSGANFAEPKLTAFFTTTTYRGAFSSTADWTDGWAEFQPLNKVY